MQRPYATGYLLAVALFLICCWVDPNNAIPYRSRPRAKVQADQWVDNTAETSRVNGAHRVIGQPDLGADKISPVSSGGKKWRSSQRFRSPRRRIKNINVNINSNIIRRDPSTEESHEIDESTYRLPKIDDVATVTAVYEVPKTNMEPTLIEKTINCSEPHNANNRYSSSFNANSTRKALNVGDDFQVTGEAGTKRTTSVHVGEDITLCWIETTTIKEDRSLHPVQRFVIREYTISFENSATIPERYLECVQLEGEIDGKNDSVPRSALFEIMDEDTRHSRVVNFTTVSHSDGLTEWQHRRVRCGVGPVVTKNIIEWADEHSDNTKKRVEIKVSPKLHRLSAQPTATEPCTTDLVDPELTSFTPTNPPSSVDYSPGTVCKNIDDCVDEYYGYSTTSVEGSTSSDLQDVTTQSYVTPSTAEGERDEPSIVTDDNESSELLLGGTPESIDSSEEMTTPIPVNTELTLVDDGLSTKMPIEVTTSVDDENQMTTPHSEILSSTESGSLLSVTLIHKTTNAIETGNQEVDMPEISEELSLSTSENDNSCENGDVCTDLSSEDSTNSLENLSNSEMEISDTVTRRDGETDDSEEFVTTPTTDATEGETDYLSEEEWDNTIETTDIGNATFAVTEPETILGGETTTGETTTTTDIGSATFAATEPETILGGETTTGETTTTTDIGSATFAATEPETILGGETTTGETTTTTDIGSATFAATEPETILGGETTTGETTTTTDIGSATFAATEPETILGGETTTGETTTTTDIGNATFAATEPETILGGETTTGETTTTTDIGSATFAATEPETILGGETTTGETTTTTDIGNATFAATEPETILGGETTTGETTTTTDIGSATFAVTEPETILGGETTTAETTTTTDIGNATFAATEPEIRPGGETTTGEITTTTDIGNATFAVTEPETILGGETTMGETTTTTDIGIATFAATEPETRLGDETTTGESTTDSNAAEVTTPSTILDGEITSDSSDPIIQVTAASIRLDEEKNITSISDVTIEAIESSTSVDGQSEFTAYTTDSLAEEITGTVIVTTTEQSDLGTITGIIPDKNSTNSVQYNRTLTIVTVIGPTTITDGPGESSTKSMIDLVAVSGDVGTTTDYFTVPSAEARVTKKPATLHSCDPESDNCTFEDDSNSASCDENSDNCSSSSSVSSISSCDEESGDCSAGTTSSSTILCDEKLDDCTIGSSSTLTTECDEESNSSCTGTSDDQRYPTSADSLEMCNKIGTGNCIMEPEITDHPPTISSTPFEVENIATTVSDVLTMVDSRRSTTVKAMSRDPNPHHKLALTIKILLEHIDKNQKKQQLVEVEKHLLFHEYPDEHDKQSLMKQVRALNNTVSMRTIQALFNCSSVEKLTGDVGDSAAKYFTLHDDIPQGEQLNNNFSHIADLHVHNPQDLSPRAKQEVDTNVEMSLPGVHADIHSGLSHVMTQVPSEYGIDQRSPGMSEEIIPRSRLLEVVANPRDERVHTRRKRQTIEDLTIDQQDLPKDLEEVGHWSNERVRRAINGGRVRTVTEFTIYKSPKVTRRM